MEILDSGARVEFDSGAVRDIKEGKGRCDLLPLDVVVLVEGITIANDVIKEIKSFNVESKYKILICIERYKESLNIDYLVYSLVLFSDILCSIGKIHNWCDAWIELSKHYEEGAKKYSDRNWQKGIPVHSFIDSATRHYMKWLYEWNDEPHDRAFMWNIVGAIWTSLHRPDLIDINLKEILTITKGDS